MEPAGSRAPCGRQVLRVVSEARGARRIEDHWVFKSHYCTSPSLPHTLTEGSDRHTVVCPLSLSLNIFRRRMVMIQKSPLVGGVKCPTLKFLSGHCEVVIIVSGKSIVLTRRNLRTSLPPNGRSAITSGPGGR